MFYYFFLAKNVITSVIGQKHPRFSYFYVLKAIFIKALNIFLDVFYYFGHLTMTAPRLEFSTHFSPSII